MIIKSRYKIARRLGAPIFEKTQTAKYTLRQERREKGAWRPKSDFGMQMLEKQKARFSYGVNERQFSKYVRESSAKRGVNMVQALFDCLEMRLDNVVYRLGFAPTRSAARQMVSHAHIRVNGKRLNIPSYRTEVGDVITVRAASAKSPMFATFDEKMKAVKLPEWLSYDPDKKEAKVTATPRYQPQDNHFDLRLVIEFYSR
ncbi:MAG TPA: 30S ribosomal protein S4 [Candidatus Paceibacterota bacterium]|nr:30S ribosomal protein S4 [Candidatus Paceibacterota bacterium]